MAAHEKAGLVTQHDERDDFLYRRPCTCGWLGIWQRTEDATEEHWHRHVASAG